MALFGSGSIQLVASGTEIPVYLLDGTVFTVSVKPEANVGDLCVAIRDKLDISLDHEYGLMDYYRGVLSLLRDDSKMYSVLRKWTASDVANGERRLYFKRRSYQPDGPVDEREDAATSTSDPYHRVVFAECQFHFLECSHRFPRDVATLLSALLLQARRGDFQEGRDSPEVVTPLMEDLVPAYLLRDAPDAADRATRAALKGPKKAGAGAGAGKEGALAAQKQAAGAVAGLPHGCTYVFRHVGRSRAEAVSKSDAADLVLGRWRKLKGVSRLSAEREFVEVSKDFVAFGAQFFVGKRTWKTMNSKPSEAVVRQRTEDVTVGVSHDGVHLTGMEDPLALEQHLLVDIDSWTLSKDKKVFALKVKDEADTFLVYVVSDQAQHMEAALELNVAEIMAQAEGSGASERKGRPGFADPSKPPATVVSEAKLEALPGRPAGEPSWSGGKDEVTGIPEDATAPGEAAAGGAVGGGAGEVEGARGRIHSMSHHPGKEDKEDEDKEEKESAGDGGEGEGEGEGEGAEVKLAPGWSKITDDDGDTFYAHEDGRTQWDPPMADGEEEGEEAGDKEEPGDEEEKLLPGWSKVTDEDGDTFYVHEDGDTYWEAPLANAADGDEDGDKEDLPEGWSKVTDDDGDTFYAHKDGRTYWDAPTE